MIHTVEVGRDVQVAELKKLFRKKLMTGGAIVRLAPDLTQTDMQLLFKRFSEGALRNSLQAEVLKEIARKVELTPELRTQFLALKLPEVDRIILASAPL